MPIQISAVIITKNEELNIGRCLKALSGWVDEIIVVDSFSSDRTQEICAQFPEVRFESREWMGFSATKNHANSLARFDYLLSIDADEEVSPELRSKFLELKSSLSPDSKIAFDVDRLTNYCGQWIWHSGWRPDYQLRFFPRGLAEWDGAEVHETMRMRSEQGSERKKLTGAFLNHYSFYSIADHVERVNRYSSLGALKIVRKRKKQLVARAVFNALFRFTKSYFLKLGILDGFYGFVIAVISGYAVFLKYSKAYQIIKTEKSRNGQGLAPA